MTLSDILLNYPSLDPNRLPDYQLGPNIKIVRSQQLISLDSFEFKETIKQPVSQSVYLFVGGVLLTLLIVCVLGCRWVSKYFSKPRVIQYDEEWVDLEP